MQVAVFCYLDIYKAIDEEPDDFDNDNVLTTGMQVAVSFPRSLQGHLTRGLMTLIGDPVLTTGIQVALSFTRSLQGHLTRSLMTLISDQYKRLTGDELHHFDQKQNE